MIFAQDPVKVLEVKGNKVKIQAARLSACSTCTVPGHIEKPDFFEIWIGSQTDAKPGDLLKVGMSPGKLYLAMGMIFFLPILFFIGGYVGFQYLWKVFSQLQSPVLFNAFGAVIGLFIALGLLRFFNNYAVQAKGFLPEAIKKVRVRKDYFDLDKIETEY